MVNITEPEVVFCEFNHIYDKSLNDSCPYCKQIAERTNQMKRQLNGSSQKAGSKFWSVLRSGRGTDSDATVLRRNVCDDDDDATVLMSGHRDDDDDVTELHIAARGNDDDKTEYREAGAELTELKAPQAKPEEAPVETIAIRFGYTESEQEKPAPLVIDEIPEQQSPEVTAESEEAVQAVLEEISEEQPVQREEPCEEHREEQPEEPRFLQPVAQPEEVVPDEQRRKVIGWLVCAMGEPNYGTSVELREGNNGVVFDQKGRVQIGEDGPVVIYRDRMTGIFQIRAEGESVATVNERTLSGSTYLEPYSRIQIGEHGFVFFPAVGVCGFEWR